MFSVNESLSHLNTHAARKVIHFTLVCHNFLSNSVLQLWYTHKFIQLNKTVALKLNS